MRLLTLLLVSTVLIAGSSAFAAGPVEESAVVVLRGSSAPPTPWYEPPPPTPSDADVGTVPYVLPYYYLPYSTLVLQQRFVPRHQRIQHRQTMMSAPHRK
jgi:hypothetical protein